MEKGEKGEAKAFEMQWGEGEAPTPVDDPVVLGDQIRQWVSSLLAVSLTLGVVWTMREIHVGKILIETGEGPYNWAILGKRFNRLLVQADREEHGLDTRLDHRLASLGAHVAQRKLLWLCHAWENGDTFAVTMTWSCTTLSCPGREICFVVFSPCKHKCCESCWDRSKDATMAQDPKAAAAAPKCPSGHPTGFVRCPFCTRTIENHYIADLNLLENQHPFLRDGVSIASCFAGLVPLLCETLRWASKATDPKERPPLARGLKLVRLSIIESDSKTEGSVTTFLEGGCRLAQLVTGACATSGGLHQRVTGDGRHQCVWESA